MDQRLIHDHADDMARQILATVKDCLFEEEHRIAFDEFYDICRRELENYEAEAKRIEGRLRPSTN